MALAHHHINDKTVAANIPIPFLVLQPSKHIHIDAFVRTSDAPVSPLEHPYIQ